MSPEPRWGIVGGGMLGLALAHRLAQAGGAVTLFEAAPFLGGLASAWDLDGVVWDRHYHVTLLSDTHLRALLSELGLEHDMEWKETRTGCYTNGRLYSVSNTVEFLRFPPLMLIDKLRLGGTILYGSTISNWERLERIPVEQWLSRWSGRRTFERFWLPLLKAKLGDSYQQASAAFIWATIQRLYAARRTGLKKEMFGYVPGGYARILETFSRVLAEEGVELRLGALIEGIQADDEGVRVNERGVGGQVFDGVAVTVNTSIAARMLGGLTAEERAGLEAIRYQGVVCASLLLEKPLSPFYLTYITDDAPFTAVVEMSAFVDRRHFGGRSLVYLPKYCRPDDPIARMSDDEIQRIFLAALERMYPEFRRDDIVTFRLSRVREVFAIPTLGYSTRVPQTGTSIPGVDLVTSAQIVNGTLNVNETLQLAERAANEMLGRRGRTAAADRQRASTADRGAPTERNATLSIDLDNLWSYLKTRGDRSWESLPSFLDVVVPRILAILGQRDLMATWFVVGRDAALEQDRPLLAEVVDAGHEIGNHSFGHDPWLHRYTRERLERELALAEDAIEAATGLRPNGFRSPGYSLSREVLATLERRGYRYDASTLPSFTGPLARAFYVRTARLSAEERVERSDLFGPFRDGIRPLKPYRWRLDGSTLVEVPITTLPILRTPIHMSYLMYIAERSPALALQYLRSALRLCRLFDIQPSLLLHSHDFVGADDVPALSFFPGFRLPGEAKMRFVGRCLDVLHLDFRVLPLGGYVDELHALPTIDPRFPQERRGVSMTDDNMNGAGRQT
jgi:protoporphyrinogen oxidase